jgi:hypothetical protein
MGYAKAHFARLTSPSEWNDICISCNINLGFVSGMLFPIHHQCLSGKEYTRKLIQD